MLVLMKATSTGTEYFRRADGSLVKFDTRKAALKVFKGMWFHDRSWRIVDYTGVPINLR